MKTTLLKDVPRQCPVCDTHIYGSAPRPKIAKFAWIIAGIGVLATIVWIFLFLTFSEIYLTPRGLRGIIICALVYGWPFYISALIIWRLPMEVTAKCFKCKWKQTYKIGTPKI